MKKTILLTTCAFLGLSACSGGGGGNGGGTAPGLPTLNNPTAHDLVALTASQGSHTTNARGLDVRTAAYVDGGTEKTARLVGSQSAGLLETRGSNAARSDFDLVGGDSSQVVNHRAHYVGDAAGVVRISSDQAVEAVRGTATVALNTTTGEWEMGSDLWMADGQNGIYVGADGGVVDGNMMTFSGDRSVVVNMHPLNAENKGVTDLNEKVRTDVVFSDDGKDAFGKMFGSNSGSGFLVDAGFAGTEYTGN